MSEPNLITIENWEEYAGSGLTRNFLGYLDATEQILPILDRILQTSTDFKEMKFELTKLIQERTAFVTHANKNLP